jgi:hypothetical protein
MQPWIYRGLILFFSAALCLSITTWSGARRELRAVTAANESLRKTLGDLIVAMGERDREIERLAGFACDGGERRSAPAGPVKPLTPAPKSGGL